MVKFTKAGYGSFCTWSYYKTAGNKQILTRFLPFFLVLLFLSGIAFGQSPIGKPGKAADFEIDGDFISNNYTSPGLDWRSVLKPGVSPYVVPGISTVAGENAKWIVDGNSGSANNEGEVFKGTSNKNGDFIGAGQSPYTIVSRLAGQQPSAPQKNDITNVYARSKLINGHQWIMLAAETRSTDGTSYLDFEYNQAGAHITAANYIGDGLNGGRTAKGGVNPAGGTYSSGDLLFVVDFVTGGSTPIPRIFEWRPTGKNKPAYDWFEITPLPTSTVFIVTNGASVAAAGLNTAFDGNGAPSNTTLALQLVEIGVDLTGLGVAPDNPCEPNATLTCKTRSSSSYTSELKDFSLFQFSLVPPATLTKPDDQTKCPGDNVSFSSTAAGSGASATNIHWYKVTGTAPNETETEITTGITTSGLTSTLTINGVTATNAGNYRVKLSGATCGASPQNFSLTVNTTAALTDLTQQTKCPGETASFTTTASGTGANAANIHWYKVDGSTETEITAGITTNGLSSTLTITGVAAADGGTYKAKLLNATCGTPEKSSTLTVNVNAELTNLSPQTKCPGASETASFSTDVSGTGASASNVEWYFGTSTTKLTNGTKYTITVNGVTSTLTINGITADDAGTYTAKLVNATCGAPQKSNSLTVNPVPHADAGADPTAQCYKAAGNVFDLDGSKSVNGTAQWTRVSPTTLPSGITVSFDDANSFTPKVTVAGAANGIVVTLRLTVTSNAVPQCGSDYDEVTIEVKAQAQGKDGIILPITCTDRGFQLKIASPDAGTTYTVTQPCNSIYSSTGTLQNDGSLLFTNLKFAAGYKIVADINGCVAAPVICGGTDCSDICATQNLTTSVNNTTTNKTMQATNIDARIESSTSVIAAPNPFSDKIRFSLQSAVSGQGSLELYNMLGQKVKTVFQGYVEKGLTKTIEYSVPGPQRQNLIYLFRVGDQKVSGKLIGLK